jgi:hypothetical protein
MRGSEEEVGSIWCGGKGDDEWLPRREIEETIALDEWLRQRSDGYVVSLECWVCGGQALRGGWGGV